MSFRKQTFRKPSNCQPNNEASIYKPSIRQLHQFVQKQKQKSRLVNSRMRIFTELDFLMKY